MQHSLGIMKTRYEDSLFFQINSSAKYFNMLFEQIFKEINVGISSTEHLALTIISQTENCCQRDLARVLLKDRANTGKLVNALEEKKYIEIEQKTKNNRMVKILTVTKKGTEINKKVMQKVQPLIDKITDEASRELIEMTKLGLKAFTKIVEKAVKINI